MKMIAKIVNVTFYDKDNKPVYTMDGDMTSIDFSAEVSDEQVYNTISILEKKRGIDIENNINR